MPYIGAHMPISGGMEKALYEGKRLGCEVVQIFTHNTNSWYMKPISSEQLELFEDAKKKTKVIPVSVHVGYLINIASSENRIWKNSVNALKKEVQRAELLGIPYVVMHPGAHKGAGEKEGIKRISEGLKEVIFDTSQKTRILLETTAGQGTSIGYRFEHLSEIIEKVAVPERMGVCLDTCHIFSAGYDFRTQEQYEALMEELEKLIGIDYVFLIHINDSKKECGSRVDRHMHIGKGKIGEKGLGFFLKDNRFKDISFIIETPKEKDENGVDYDIINLQRLRQIIKGEET
jgi:deoxyribonuclease-4